MNFSRETSSWLEGLRSTAERVLESPKVLVTTATASSTAGAAVAAQWITGTIGVLATVAGIAATLLLARVNWLKGEQHKLEMEHQRLKNELLKHQAREMGVELREEEL